MEIDRRLAVVLISVMKRILLTALLLALAGCASIPKQTVDLSKAIGEDLQILQKTHTRIIELHFDKIINDINSLVDEVYKPFVISSVLNEDLEKFKAGGKSDNLFGALETSTKVSDAKQADALLEKMSFFIEAIHDDVEDYRDSLLSPIRKQKEDLLAAVNQSYDNAKYANATITAHLESIQKLKTTQQEALARVGLSKADSIITNSLVKLSDQVEKAVQQGRDINLKSDQAKTQLDEVSKKIKELTLKKK